MRNPEKNALGSRDVFNATPRTRLAMRMLNMPGVSWAARGEAQPMRARFSTMVGRRRRWHFYDTWFFIQHVSLRWEGAKSSVYDVGDNNLFCSRFKVTWFLFPSRALCFPSYFFSRLFRRAAPPPPPPQTPHTVRPLRPGSGLFALLTSGFGNPCHISWSRRVETDKPGRCHIWV